MASVDLRSKITLDSSQFEAGLRKAKTAASMTGKAVGKSFQKLGGVIGNVTKVATKFATVAAGITFAGAVAGATSLIKSSIKIASNYEQIRVKMANFVGSTKEADKILKDISKFSTVTPFETTGLQEVVNLLLGAGIAAKDAVPVMKELAAVSKDTGQVAELGDALAKGFAKGKFQTEELNKFLERGINLMPQLERVTGKTGVELQKAIQAGLKFDDVRKAIAGMSAEGGLFFGMLEKQSTTYEGLISTLASNWDELRTAIGQPIADALKPVLENGISMLQSLMDEAKAFGQTIGTIISGVSSMLKKGEWRDLIELMKNGLIWAGEEFIEFMKPHFVRLATSFGEQLVKATNNAFAGTRMGAILGFNKVGKGAAGAGILNGSGSNNKSTAQQKFEALWDKLTRAAEKPSGAQYSPKVAAAVTAFNKAFEKPKTTGSAKSAAAAMGGSAAGAAPVNGVAMAMGAMLTNMATLHARRGAAASAAGFGGLAGYHKMQLDRQTGVGVGTTTALSQGPKTFGRRSGAIGRNFLGGMDSGTKVNAKDRAREAAENEKLQLKGTDRTNELLAEQNKLFNKALS